MKKEYLFLIIAAVCLLSIAIFMIGGILQNTDYHKLDLGGELTQELREELKKEYEVIEKRVKAGRMMQLVGAIATLTGFVAVAAFAITVGVKNSEKYKK